MIKIEYYYKQPKQEYFDELKSACIKFWRAFDDQFGYATEKIDSIKDLENNSTNYMLMVKILTLRSTSSIFSPTPNLLNGGASLLTI